MVENCRFSEITVIPCEKRLLHIFSIVDKAFCRILFCIVESNSRKLFCFSRFNALIIHFYSNRVPVEVVQPVAVRLPFASNTSTVPVVVKSSPLAPSSAVCLTFCVPMNVPVGL